MPLPELGCLAL